MRNKEGKNMSITKESLKAEYKHVVSKMLQHAQNHPDSYVMNSEHKRVLFKDMFDSNANVKPSCIVYFEDLAQRNLENLSSNRVMNLNDFEYSA